jgi:hypothetical protein
LPAGLSGLSRERESSFLTLLRKLLFAFFGLKQHVVSAKEVSSGQTNICPSNNYQSDGDAATVPANPSAGGAK